MLNEETLINDNVKDGDSDCPIKAGGQGVAATAYLHQCCFCSGSDETMTTGKDFF